MLPLGTPYGVDSGQLEQARLVEVVADFLRFQMISMRLGKSATLSIHVLPNIEDAGPRPTVELQARQRE